MPREFNKRCKKITSLHAQLIRKENKAIFSFNGIFNRYENPILTRYHIPLNWRFDFHPATNPFFMEPALASTL